MPFLLPPLRGVKGWGAERWDGERWKVREPAGVTAQISTQLRMPTWNISHPLTFILLHLLLSQVYTNLPPPKENFRKIQKKILDKLFSPEVYDKRMRPRGKSLTVRKNI